MRRMRQLLTNNVLSGLCVFILSAGAHAEMYKWVDEQGVTQYTEKPPANRQDVERLDIQVAPANEEAINKLKQQINQADHLRDERLKAADEKRLLAEEQALKVENCRRSRARLASYSVPNALIAQPDGSRIRVDEETRQRELVTSREMIEKYCN
jgi:hypothetical protein